MLFEHEGQERYITGKVDFKILTTLQANRVYFLRTGND